MDSGGWFVIDELPDKANRYVYSVDSRIRSTMTLSEVASLASDGTEDLSKLRWPFCVSLKRSARPGVYFCQRIVKVFRTKGSGGAHGDKVSRRRLVDHAVGRRQ